MMDTAQNQTRTINRYRDISLHLTKLNLRLAEFSGQPTQCEISGIQQISNQQNVLDVNSSKLDPRKGINTTNSMVLRLEMPQIDQLNQYDKLLFFVNTTHLAVYTVRAFPELFFERKHNLPHSEFLPHPPTVNFPNEQIYCYLFLYPKKY